MNTSPIVAVSEWDSVWNVCQDGLAPYSLGGFNGYYITACLRFIFYCPSNSRNSQVVYPPRWFSRTSQPLQCNAVESFKCYSSKVVQ
jgi:hypothetical protein